MKIKKAKKFFLQHLRLLIMICAVLGLSGVLTYKLVIVKQEYIIVRVKGSPGNWWWVTPRPPDWLAFSIKKGDKEYNSANKATAEVMAVDVYDAGGSTRDAYLSVRLAVQHNKKTNQYRYKGEPVAIGDPISLDLNNAFFPGMIVAIYKDGEYNKQYVEKIVHIRHKNRWPYEFDAIHVGDTIVDGDGIVITEILEKSRTPALTEAANNNGQLVRTASTIYEDFYLTVKLKMVEQNGEFVYREEQYIKTGSSIWLLFTNYNLSEGEILSVE